jgi:intracellular sulfur oxidation DsrE/DsrF family protein
VRAVVAAGLVALCVAGVARGELPRDDAGTPLRVVVHVNFADPAQQGRGLENVENVLKAAAAAGLRAEVEVVCHAEGIGLVVRSKTAHAGPVEALRKQGVRFVACENTMRKRSLRKEDLLPGVTTVPSGAFEVVVKQRDGYSYFKP